MERFFVALQLYKFIKRRRTRPRQLDTRGGYYDNDSQRLRRTLRTGAELQGVNMKEHIFALLILSLACAGAHAADRPSAAAPAPAKPELLAAEGKKNMLPDGGWFTWRFAEKPKLGTVIVKVQVFDKAGARVKPYEIAGESGMPSMRYHDSGPVKFQLNKKGDYLLPVNVVMAGEWQLIIRVKKGKKEIYAGKVLFSV